MIAALAPRVKATLALMRLQEITLFVLVTTLLGADVGGARPGARLVIVTVANLLAVAFAFMLNDVEDAPDDALTPAKAARNPVAAGRLSPRAGYIASFAVAIAGLGLYATLGMWPLLLGGLCLGLGVLYSWRKVRLKAIPIADLLSHASMLAALQFLCAYTAFRLGGWAWLVPCLFAAAVSLYGQLFNQLRDLDGDRQAGIKHTAARIGPRAAHVLMISMLVGAAALLALSLWQGSIPLWTMGLSAALLPAVLVVQAWLGRLSGSFSLTQPLLHRPVLACAVAVLVTWLVAGAITI